MANSCSIKLCFLAFVLASSLTIIPSNCFPGNDEETGHVALFIFGDSLFDAGNNNYINTSDRFRANFWPYGESFFKYATGRFSDGRLIPDFIAEYANLSLISPFLGSSYNQLDCGVNFASAGAGALVETYSGMVINLKMQLNRFGNVEEQLRLKLGAKQAKQHLSNAVYLFSIGNNDYTSPFFSNSSVLDSSHTPEEYVNMVVGNFTFVIKEIYKKGGRKFGFINLGPLEYLPSSRALQVGGGAGRGDRGMEEIKAMVKLHNMLLSKKLKQLQKELKGFLYSYFDFYATIIEILKSPLTHGFKEVKNACCGSGPYRGISSCGGKRGVKEYELCDSPRDYLFYDSGHPTESANQQLAKLMWHGAPKVTGPYNLKSFFQLKVQP